MPVISLSEPSIFSLLMKRVRTLADKDRDALAKREKRKEGALVHLDVPATTRDYVNVVRQVLGYPDQRSVISDGVNLLSNYKSSKESFIETEDKAATLFIGSKDILIDFVNGLPCRKCCAPVMISSTTNLGTSISHESK